MVRAKNNRGYNLIIGNSYEVKYVDHIDVIEDKGGTTTYMLWKQPGRCQTPLHYKNLPKSDTCLS